MFFCILQSEIFRAMLNFRFASDEHGLHGPWKVLEKASCPWKVLENWKIVGWLEKSLNFPQKSLNIFESSSFVKRKTCFAQKNDWKEQQYTIFFGYHESVFLWFWCSWHSSFSVIWSTLGTVPKWRKVL